MAPNLAVKSESWLDLSERSELIEACKIQQNSRRQFERGASVEPSCLAGSQARRHSSPFTPTSPRNQQHLLIRLRQHAYLARSDSTTLSSSNLSASIDLSPALDSCRVNQCNDRNQDEDERSDHQNAGPQSERRRELSFGLRSFRARFERRRARTATAAGRQSLVVTRDRPHERDGETCARAEQPREASPFARSWSSLSQHLESRLSHLGHSCKSFLYKYQKRRTGQETTHDREQDRSAFNRSKQQGQFLAPDNTQNLFTIKRRLTSDWVARHCARADTSKPQHLAAIDRGRAASERPRSVQIENGPDCQWQRLAGESVPAARQTTNIGFQQRASSEFCRRAPAPAPAAPESGESRTTSSSTTLVSESEKIRCKKGERVRTRKKSARRRDNDQQVGRARREARDEESSSSSTSTMSSGGQQQQQASRRHTNETRQLVPPAATSDYWSGGATTATASEFELQRNLAAGQAERLVGAAGPFPLDDQDYYLDVANAGGSTQQAPVAHHLDMNQQQQQLLMRQLQQEQMVLAAAELEADYDDYAVPSDENGCRLDRSQVELVRLIGEGQKGFVFLGKLQSRDGSTLIDVAIKTLKYETEQLIERLMAEAATMKQLEHPHIIKFIGMCPETPALIAMELAQFGELKHYLKINRHLIKCSQLVLFTFQISTALSYLESKNYVHRDVAARNVLVCSHNCVKLADFGLSRNLQTLQHAHTQPSLAPIGANNLLLAPQSHQNHSADQSLYVAAPRGKLPVRWLAPESLVFRRFTSASDVWMFAVCAWELFHFGQLRPWAQLRNQQVLLAIESGQRPQRPPACPERLYALMLKCWSYAPVQRPKFREIKQCIWSIYLNERTREQAELERLEQVRQKYLLMARHQQQQQQQPTVNRQNQQQQHMLMSYSTPSNYSSAATTDNEQSTSPCSSAFNSMGRGNSAMAAQHQQQQKFQQHQQRPVQVQPEAAHQNQGALQSQLSRFKQRQQQTPADFRPHALQKQRSQGAIGLSMTTTTTTTARRKQREAEQPLRGESCCRVARARDDQAIELAKRGSGATAAHQLYRPAFFGSDEEDEEQENEDDDDDEDSAMGSPTMPSHGPARPLPFAGAGGRVMSASPALTADGGARSQSRMVSLEPAYEGLFARDPQAGPAGRHAPSSSRPASRAGGGQVAMLRANFDLANGSRGTSPVLTNATTSPALTTSNSNPPTRPVSWRNSSELDASINHHNNRQQQSAAYKQPDQLGQMLRALRITPMKARLKQPPEQSVRVLQRDSSKSPAQPAPRRPEAGGQRQQPPPPPVEFEHAPEVDEHTRQLMVHQRLLGRIRPSSIVADPRARTPTSRAEESPSSRQQVAAAGSSASRARQLIHQKSVEAVDHSLQILESLMSSGGGGGGGLTGRTTTSTLPRKRTAR